MEGSLSERLASDENRLLLLSYLLGELQAARMISATVPAQGMKVEMVTLTLHHTYCTFSLAFKIVYYIYTNMNSLNNSVYLLLMKGTQKKLFFLFKRESEQAKDLKNLLIALLFPKPPANITPKQLFVKVKDKVRVMNMHACMHSNPGNSLKFYNTIV